MNTSEGERLPPPSLVLLAIPLLLNAHRPDTLAIVAAVAARADTARIEVKAATTPRTARIERARPIVAV